MVHRQQFDSSDPRGGRGAEKGDPDEPADHALGYSRGGFGTKIHLVCDSNAVPLGIQLSAGQRNESIYVEPTLNAVRIERPRARPERLAADKGYAYPVIRRWLRRHQIDPIIPKRENHSDPDTPDRPAFDAKAYRRRNIIERCVGWLKECRRVATRFEKLALNFLAMLKLAMIGRCLRILLSDSA